MNKTIDHPYGIIFVKTTQNELEINADLLKSIKARFENEPATIIEMTRIQYENTEMPIDYAVEILDLIENFTMPFILSNVQFNCDPQHGELITQLFKDNPNCIEGDVIVKVETPMGYAQVYPSI